MTTEQPLGPKQQAIAPIAAAMAVGNMTVLNEALNQGLDDGLSVSDVKEILVQLYAYTGFPRSLNALAEFMKVVDERKQRGVQDVAGHGPGPIPTGKELLAVGTANQTKLSGLPVTGPLFDFAPQVDEYLKTHLFGDVFARDNLDWQSRELATVGALAALPGVESQLQAHVRISMNVGLTAFQLRQAADVLADRGQPEAATRARAAVEKHLATTPAMKVQMKIGARTVVIVLADNPTSRDFYSMLPLKVTLEDYASSEKVTYLSRKLSTVNAPKAVTPVRGDVGYYAPWGNIALYYRDGPHSPGLVPLGRIESGLEVLEERTIRGTVEVTRKSP